MTNRCERTWTKPIRKPTFAELEMFFLDTGERAVKEAAYREHVANPPKFPVPYPYVGMESIVANPCRRWKNGAFGPTNFDLESLVKRKNYDEIAKCKKN